MSNARAKPFTASTAPANLTGWMAREATLASLIPQARAIAACQRVLLRHVPTSLGHAARVVAVRGDTLVIHADYPAVAAKLKQLVPGLLVALDEQFAGRGTKITAINIKVQQPEDPPAERVSQIEPLRAAPSKTLRDVANYVSDGPLKEVLKRF